MQCSMLDDFHQPSVVDGIEESTDVRVEYPVPSIYSSARTELAKLLIYGLFRKIRVLAQDAVGFTIVWPEGVIFRSMMTYHSPPRNGQSWQV